jgi:type II secretory pathway predicted ATPase ExeA
VYREFFELDDYPFRLTADVRYFYLTGNQARAKSYLKYLLHIRDGVAVITGDPGVGKTALLEHVLAELGERVVVGRIGQTQLSTTEFLLAVCLAFGLQPERIHKASLIKDIERYVLNEHFSMRTVVLVVDEAHNLNVNILEELRMLANLEKYGRKLMQIVLAGQPSLGHLLSPYREESLSQMVRLSCHIEPMSLEEVRDYIRFRLQTASLRKEVVSVDNNLLPGIMCYTGGIPRLVNILCDTMLIFACMRYSPTVDASCFHLAINKLAWPTFMERKNELPEPGPQPLYIQDQRPVASLIVRANGKRVAEYLLNKQRIRIGRKQDMDIQLEGRKVSRYHAHIVHIGGNYYLHDLNSTNGTYLGYEPVKWHALQNHDRIRIGDYLIEFSETAAQALPQDSSQKILAAAVS